MIGTSSHDERRVLARTKNNLAAFPLSLAFRINEAESSTTRIDRLGHVDLTDDDSVQHHHRRSEAVPRAVRFVQEHLP